MRRLNGDIRGCETRQLSHVKRGDLDSSHRTLDPLTLALGLLRPHLGIIAKALRVCGTTSPGSSIIVGNAQSGRRDERCELSA